MIVPYFTRSEIVNFKESGIEGLSFACASCGIPVYASNTEAKAICFNNKQHHTPSCETLPSSYTFISLKHALEHLRVVLLMIVSEEIRLMMDSIGSITEESFEHKVLD